MLQYDKSAGVVHVDWFHPWKPNRFSSLWIWLSLTSQRFHMRMYWRHFIHHSKAIHWVINPLAYLAAGDSAAERRGWLGHKHQNTHGNARPATQTRPFFLQGCAFFFPRRGRHGDPWAERERGKKTPARSKQNRRHAPWPERPAATEKSPSQFPERRKRRGGGERQNSITQSKTTPCPLGVISAPFKSLITHKTNNILTPW